MGPWWVQIKQPDWSTSQRMWYSLPVITSPLESLSVLITRQQYLSSFVGDGVPSRAVRVSWCRCAPVEQTALDQSRLISSIAFPFGGVTLPAVCEPSLRLASPLWIQVELIMSNCPVLHRSLFERRLWFCPFWKVTLCTPLSLQRSPWIVANVSLPLSLSSFYFSSVCGWKRIVFMCQKSPRSW